MSANAAHLAAQIPAAAVRPDPTSELEPVLLRVEQRLQDLQGSLAARDMPCLELHAAELQRALGMAVQQFVHAARRGGVPRDLRQRLAQAGAQIAAQRDALARATAAMDRALDVLMPGLDQSPALYSAQGAHEHRSSGASLQA
jgi:hypothetical protein